MAVETQPDIAISFLRDVWSAGRTDDLWVLTAIEVDRKGIQTVTFHQDQGKDTEDRLHAWLHASRNCNIYFHVNPVLRPLTQKANRKDIREVAWLHVDIDPRAGEDLALEQKRALSLLTGGVQDIPLPTVVVFSGGGYQGFWKLAEPIPINGDVTRAESAKLYNVQLELAFRADQCHNIDRIMRLPGTVNIPDAKKRKKGRTPVLATLVGYWPERVYPLSAFTQAQPIQTPDSSPNDGAGVYISGNVERLAGVEALDEHGQVPDRVKMLIVQGEDPDNPHKYPSRSELLFAVCCELVRAGVPDEVVYSVITDPDFGISTSVLDKGSNSERYAKRQIERAKEEAVNPWLRKLNEKHAVIGNLGGKCRVIEEVFDPAMRRSRLIKQAFDDFRNRYMNAHVVVGLTKDGKEIFRPVGKWWLEHPKRKQYESLVFSPRRDSNGCYNLWRGFACEAHPGEPERFLWHIRNILCRGVEEHYHYLIGWMARCVQEPDSQGETAVVLRGRQGTGKSFFAKAFGSLWGRHFIQVSDPKHLVGSFNAHLRDVVVLFGDEAFYAGDHRHESMLKTLITEEYINIEGKGLDVETAPNYMHLILASNSKWVIPANADERRFFVLDVSEEKMQDRAYFSALHEEFEGGGRERLLHFLQHYDLSDFDVRKMPKTMALNDQKLFSMGTKEEWWYHKLEEGRLMPHHQEWHKSIPKEQLINDYYAYAQKTGEYRRANHTILQMFLRSVLPPGWPKVDVLPQEQLAANPYEPVLETVNVYHWVFPPLEECREAWDKIHNHGIVYPWPDVVVASKPTNNEPF